MPQRAFKQIDVFTAIPYQGNPVAVVLEGGGLTPDQMQSFTNWTNLSEATFILPPTNPSADYKLRIFCPGRELPFAGHPTLGSCHAWLEAGGKPKGEFIVQECGVGLVKIRRDGNRLAFMAPPRQKTGPLPEEDVALIARGLGITREDILHHEWCNNGPNWRAVMLKSAAQVLAIQPDASILKGLDVGVVGAQPAGSETQFEIRAFFTVPSGIAEDPVTGSLNAAIAQWLTGAGLAPEKYVASQGTALGRAGRVHVQKDGNDIWIGGDSVSCIEGSVKL